MLGLSPRGLHQDLRLALLLGDDRRPLLLGRDRGAGLARRPAIAVVVPRQQPDRPQEHRDEHHQRGACRGEHAPALDRRRRARRQRTSLGGGGAAGARGGRGLTPRAALAVRDRRDVAVRVELLQRVEQRARPAPGRLGAAQVAARRGQLGTGLLAEHVVGELAAPVLLDPARADRGQLHEGVARAFAHPRLGDAEHLGQLVVALALLEHELDDRPLLVGELIEGGHIFTSPAQPARPAASGHANCSVRARD